MSAPFDRFDRAKADIVAPAHNAAPITPSDTIDLPHVTTGIFVGTAGTVVVDMVGYEDDPGAVDVSFKAAAGSELRIRAVRVKEASTATDLVALY